MTLPSAPTTPLEQDGLSDHLHRFQRGNQTFALLFTRWMDTNGWSHPTMVTLAKGAMNGASWLHSSQIAGLRHCKLHSPGPRTFVAIERLNHFLHRYSTRKLLIPGTSSSNLYARPFPITEDGAPPPVGWWVEVFCGLRIPKDVDLRIQVFNDEQSARLSRAWGALVRRLMLSQGRDIIVELDRIIRDHYPVKESDRILQLVSVIHNREVWSADQLINELPAITALTSELGGPTTEDELLEALKS